MSRGDAAREFLYKMMPGFLGKAPEMRPSKDNKERGKEAEPLAVDAGEAVIAKSVENRDSEDTTCAEDGFFAVADGTSSKGGGGEASRMAIKVVKEQVARGRREGMTDAGREKLLKNAITMAGVMVKQAGRDIPGIFNTTFSSFLTDRTSEGKNVVTVGHVGDSGVYHYQAKDRRLIKLTRGSGLLDALAETGIVSDTFSDAVDQSVDEGKDVASPSREKVLAGIKMALGKKSLSANQRTRLEYLRRKFSGTSKQSVAEFLYQNRHQSFDNLAPGKEEDEHNVQVRTVGVEDGDMVFAASDGLDDVLTKARIQELIEQGLTAGKTMREISAGLAQEASQDTSKRQKGSFIKRPGTSELVQEGDDVGIAGAIFARAERPLAAVPRETPARVESPARVQEWELTLEDAEAPDQYAKAKSAIGLRASWHEGALRRGNDKRKQMENQGMRFLNDAVFVSAWRAELDPTVAEARARLKEVYTARGEADKLAQLERDALADAQDEALRLAR